ncbi:MAG: FAD-dependent oxidoreductase, partial [Clostridiales bacterium]|nr:FAD-dependent oxidoreductase [Clostridiales bacterium]
MRNFALTVNGAPITAHEGQSVLEAALAAGIYIPSLCSHPDLKPQGGCKLCLVEVEGQENPVCSCETKAAEGMRVLSDTELVKRLRRTSMELMLASHPTDCTSCSAYLNCELQALMQYLGVAHSRLRSVEKRNVAKSNGLTDPLIKRDMVRCIQCGRCVRACEELRGVGALEMKVENGESYVGVKGASYLDGGCRFCGACIEVCPTGAIQDTPGLFKALKGESLVPCKAECPAHVDIPRYVRFAREKKYSNAVEVLRERLTFPHALGYVCSHKCEFSCKRGHLDEAVSIKEIKKFCLENDKSSSWFLKVKKLEISGKTVGIIGAGPCGLTAAWHLARKGHKVEVFERRPLPGGMLRYGIPKHRLDRSVVDSEAGIITSIGVEIKSGTEITSALSLKERYGAVFIAVGAQLGARAPVDVSGCQNVWQAVEFCALAEQDALPPMGSFVTVLGGGNVALDCARIAVRAGAKRVRVACLESRVAMLAEKDEITAALSEGV